MFFAFNLLFRNDQIRDYYLVCVGVDNTLYLIVYVLSEFDQTRVITATFPVVLKTALNSTC